MGVVVFYNRFAYNRIHSPNKKGFVDFFIYKSLKISFDNTVSYGFPAFLRSIGRCRRRAIFDQ
jgi:hypothetical protein